MYKNLSEVKAKNKEIGHHFFELGTMRWFNSRIKSGVYGGKYFITSEVNDLIPNHPLPRAYTVRMADETGRIHTVSDNGQFATLEQARACCKGLVTMNKKILYQPATN